MTQKIIDYAKKHIGPSLQTTRPHVPSIYRKLHTYTEERGILYFRVTNESTWSMYIDNNKQSHKRTTQNKKLNDDSSLRERVIIAVRD